MGSEENTSEVKTSYNASFHPSCRISVVSHFGLGLYKWYNEIFLQILHGSRSAICLAVTHQILIFA